MNSIPLKLISLHKRMVKSDVNKLEIKGKDGNEVEYVFKTDFSNCAWKRIRF
jgi:hypothetical protein